LPGTTPLQDSLAAFKTVLDAAGLGVEVYEQQPYEGAELRSVVLTPVAGHTVRPALGLRITSTMRALEEHCRLQVGCFHDEQADCRSLADKLSQVIFDHVDEFERVYDIHDLRRALGPIPGPVDAGVRESYLLMDFEFYTHRAVT
jgi:hypothetical protein